ncbi:sigma-54 interaction domain-containing protein [Neptunicella marina]|uniref:Sigma 54-interacting transcriptional regulator n=1 Tax=Neptunicella marina TaxID=2125989 RepID=A0A8J6ITW4_9ALTE|nr:sigma 54-interacting transcriptional regulator [Neptunicella marina]MBC3767305.1 sigma 54-interacting transcriptional regulator [Neptunicella marina]
MMAPENNALTDLLELNSLILNSVGEGVYGINKEGFTTFSNPAAERMTGWSVADLQGRQAHSIWHHTKCCGAHYPQEECPIYMALKDGVVHHEQDELFWRKDGSSFPVEYTSTPMIRDGHIVGAVVVFRDITTRKQNEKKLTSALEEVKRLQKQLQAENRYLKAELREQHQAKSIVAGHAKMKTLLQLVRQVAPTDASVLIQGETGTGKELIANEIHHLSPRSKNALVKINCGAIPHNLVESELFGHEKGAFTGATSTRIGRFELANGGTLFLDEVAELPADTQTKLLRVLQEGEFERVGGHKTIKVDVRIVAASHKNLQQLSEAGDFRLDLFYRLSVFPVQVPPLRERISDIPMLANSIVQQLGVKLGRHFKALSQASLSSLMAYSWLGNVRELQNVLERAAILSLGDEIHITPELLPVTKVSNPIDRSADQSLAAFETAHITNILQRTGWKISGSGGAAEILDMHPNTLRARMDKLGIKNRLKA